MAAIAIVSRVARGRRSNVQGYFWVSPTRSEDGSDRAPLSLANGTRNSQTKQMKDQPHTATHTRHTRHTTVQQADAQESKVRRWRRARVQAGQ